MPSYGTYRVTDKKCATCSFWGGARKIVPNRDKPFYIKALAGIHPCRMMPAKKSAGSFCSKWSKWTVISSNMGAITQDKEIYDQYAVEYFRNDGWDAFAIGKTGRYADVIAVRGSALAIIEVKSPNEKSAVKSYDDSANLSDYLNSKIGDYLKETRRKVFGLFGSGQSLEQLYAVTITSQVYRYIHEFEEKAVQYEEAIGGSVRLRGAKFNKIPYLVIPTEYTKKAEYVLKVLRSNGYISSFRTDKSSYICITEYRY